MMYYLLKPTGDAKEYLETFDMFVEMMARSRFADNRRHYRGDKTETAWVIESEDSNMGWFLGMVSLYDWIAVFRFDTEDELNKALAEHELQPVVG